MYNIKKVYYKDLIHIIVKDNGEPFISLAKQQIYYGHIKGMEDMKHHFGGEIIVRETIVEKLKLANQILNKTNKNLSLYITYGYRDSNIQKNRFNQRLNKLESKYSNYDQLYEAIHCTVAVPTVAGHPTGGAVDVLLIDNTTNKLLEFGTPIYDYTVGGHELGNKNISTKSLINRELLFNCMTKAGFAPFHGEYRHFSYGDKEWAFYYNKANAIYAQKALTDII